MIGERFSRLVVISLDHKDRAYRKWIMRLIKHNAFASQWGI